VHAGTKRGIKEEVEVGRDSKAKAAVSRRKLGLEIRRHPSDPYVKRKGLTPD